MHFQDVALSFVQPRNHNEFITHLDALKPLYDRDMHFEPGVRGTFTALPGSFPRVFER
jgi:hypothetical protein